MQNKHGLIFVAQRKLIDSYWKTPTFHGFGQMCLSEVLCLTILKLGGQWHKSQQLTQLQPVWEAHAASTFLWDQQRGLFSKWLGGLWSIDLLNFAWFTVLYLWAETQILLMAISFIPFGTGWLEEHLKWNRDDRTATCVWYWGLKMKLPQCGSNFTRSWLPCEVKSASGWWIKFWRAGIKHRKSLCKTNTDWFLLLKENS